jgi:hypothetical protein
LIAGGALCRDLFAVFSAGLRLRNFDEKFRNQVLSLKSAVVVGGKLLPNHHFVWIDAEKPGFSESARWLDKK